MQPEYNYTEDEWNRSIGWGKVPANRVYSGMKRNEGAADSGSIPDISTIDGDALASTGQDS